MLKLGITNSQKWFTISSTLDQIWFTRNYCWRLQKQFQGLWMVMLNLFQDNILMVAILCHVVIQTLLFAICSSFLSYLKKIDSEWDIVVPVALFSLLGAPLIFRLAASVQMGSRGHWVNEATYCPFIQPYNSCLQSRPADQNVVSSSIFRSFVHQ